MKNLLLLGLITLSLVSCGKKKANVVQPIQPETNVSVLNTFRSDSGLHGINEIDFSTSQIGVPVIETFCNGTYGNSGLVNGVDRGQSLLEGSETEGTLQFGNLAYVGASNPLCRAMSKERYTYKITGKVMKLCMVNYPFCADYTLVE